MIVDPCGSLGTVNPNGDAVAVERKPFSHLEFVPLRGIVGGQHGAVPIRLEFDKWYILDVETRGQFGDGDGVDVRRIGSPRDKRGHPAQRCLLRGERVGFRGGAARTRRRATGLDPLARWPATPTAGGDEQGGR